MDLTPDNAMAPDATPLSYDDTVAYEELSPPPAPSLANRIGHTKVYLLSDSAAVASKAKAGKRKRSEDLGEDMDEDVQEEEDLTHRGNAILLQGPPIAHLPTSNIFAYATHFDAHPMGLEWIDDTTCILVFDSKAAARLAFHALSKSLAEEPDPDDGTLAAKPIPVALWPAEARINKSLGKSEGLKGVVRMRWARVEDVKKKGAKKESEFYRKHGRQAGKEGSGGLVEGEGPLRKRMKGEEELRKELDQDLDEFLADDVEDVKREWSPPSKMRSDHMGDNKKSLLERTSVMRSQPVTLADRITKPLPRRRGGRSHDSEWERGKGHAQAQTRRRSAERRERPKKTQQQLDDELDAFLNEGR